MGDPRLNLNVHKNVPISICQIWQDCNWKNVYFSLLATNVIGFFPLMDIILSSSSHPFDTTVCIILEEVNFSILECFFLCMDRWHCHQGSILLLWKPLREVTVTRTAP